MKEVWEVVYRTILYLVIVALFVLTIITIASCDDGQEGGVCVFGENIYQCTKDGSDIHCDWDGSNEE